MADNMASDAALHSAICRKLRKPKWKRRLDAFRIEYDEAANELWRALVPYSRRKDIGDMDKYVTHWTQRIVQRLIDRAKKHFDNRDLREIV